jgi:O-methyltransferase
MSVDRSGVKGWKRWIWNLLDQLVLRIPYFTELWNQGMSKNLGLLAGWHFISRIELEGDYLEFGVFRGETFRNAILAARQGFRGTREGKYFGKFFAFDSFQGLPKVASMSDPNNPYIQGEFCSSRQVFNDTLGKLSQKNAVHVIEGWFSEVLNPETAKRIPLSLAAFINIDCDLYEPTVSVLEFVLPYLQTGTVIYFDDWYSLKGSIADGEGRACQEWLERHKNIKLVEYRNIGITGKMFIVNKT